MKKILSLVLCVAMLLCMFAIAPTTTTAASTFKEGDVLYLKVVSPTEWLSNDPIIYMNFTDYSRADNDNKSVEIAKADKSKYNPVTGAVYDSEKGMYKYTLTSADAGATSMRFWRGNIDKLWNCSVVITADDYADGKNVVVVDGSVWDDAGYLDTHYEVDLNCELSADATQVELGETVGISAVFGSVSTLYNYDIEVRLNDTPIDFSGGLYMFTPSKNGVYTFVAVFTATNKDGAVVAKETQSVTVRVGVPNITSACDTALYAHAYSDNTTESEAWVKWYKHSDTYYLMMPAATDLTRLQIYNGFSSNANFGGITIEAGQISVVNVNDGSTYEVAVNSNTYRVKVMRSDAESAIFVNSGTEYPGTSFWDYLTEDKENYTSATGAILDSDGTISNETIKKIKGRGNTSWDAAKKGFNVTYSNAVEIGGMESCKKFSMISNFQDAALCRNRLLYDLADEVGVPYASDSRFVEFYVNGNYLGNYQICEKIDTGKTNLIDDIDDEEYLEYVSNEKSDFAFVLEIDNNPSSDDFNFEAGNGNALTVKSPEIESGDPNKNAVREFMKSKYDTMYSKLVYDAEDIDDYIDIESLAQVYLINEFGKNWDSGAGSFFFVYKADENGKYKFFASPVWDYDNSLGNARGVESDLRRLGITDYEEPTGWFSTLKGGYRGPNFLSAATTYNKTLNKTIPTVWFEQFIPALNKLTQTGVYDEIYSADVYKSVLTKSAQMNYVRWDMVVDSSWVAAHDSIKECVANYTYNEHGQVVAMSYKQNSTATTYDQYDYLDEFDYMVDWGMSRAAWLSNEYFDSYIPSEIIPTQPPTQPPTEPPTQPVLPDPDPQLSTNNAIAIWQFDSTDKIEGEKLDEYGTKEGYTATYGNGIMTGSVDGTNPRSLEWSAVEYGTNGLNMVPIMPAGSKNLWGTPYLQFELSTAGYTDIKFTGYFAGSKKCPATWKLQYSTDAQTFVDTDTQFTITMDNRKLLTAYLDSEALPSALDNLEQVYIRLVPVSTTTVAGGDITEDPTGGELALNHIRISGTRTSTGVRGDANLDGKITILDATEIQRHLAKLVVMPDHALELADVDNTKGISILDATKIQRFLAKLEPTL